MIVTLMTDYGDTDEFAGICHGVIAGIAPDVRIIDITHGLPRHGIREGALTFRHALPFFPVGVHVAVVDPQVGTERRAVAVRCRDGRVLVGPDNGLMSLAWDALGGVEEAVDISRSRFRLEPVSFTFHGRDMFAPVAAHLANGASLREAGDALPVEELVRHELPSVEVLGSTAVAHALAIDGYGNVALNLGHGDLLALRIMLGDRLEVVSGPRRAYATYVQTFADGAANDMLLYEDAWGALALAVNRGSAAAKLGVDRDGEIRITKR